MGFGDTIKKYILSDPRGSLIKSDSVLGFIEQIEMKNGKALAWIRNDDLLIHKQTVENYLTTLNGRYGEWHAAEDQSLQQNYLLIEAPEKDAQHLCDDYNELRAEFAAGKMASKVIDKARGAGPRR